MTKVGDIVRRSTQNSDSKKGRNTPCRDMRSSQCFPVIIGATKDVEKVEFFDNDLRGREHTGQRSCLSRHMEISKNPVNGLSRTLFLDVLYGIFPATVMLRIMK